MHRNPDRKKEIYFPIEIKPREFVSRALLGAIFADNGYRVYMGAKGVVNKSVLSKTEKGGVYFYKGTRPKANTRDLIAKVDAFCVIDEEIGIALRDLDAALEQRVKGIENVDRLFTISHAVAAAVVRACPESAPKIRATGWPRVDTWRPEMAHMFRRQAENYRQRLGEFVLFSSDFGALSRQRVDQDNANMEKRGFPDSFKSHSASEAEDALADFNHFCKDLRHYDAIPDAPLLVVRPHPAEDHEIWEERLQGMTRVKVIYENEVSGWLQACRMHVHRGCTTGVEARVGGIPSFFWAPENTSPATDILPYKVSALLGSLSEIVKHWPDPNAAMPDVQIPRDQLELGEKLSIQRIFDEVDALGITPVEASTRPLNERLSVHLKAVKRRIFNSKAYLAPSYKDAKLARKLQNGFHAAELSACLADAFPTRSYTVRQVAPDFLLLEAG